MASAQNLQMMYAAASKAYFYAKAIRPVYVNLPEEDDEAGDESRCGRFCMSMYGTTHAAFNWATEYTLTLLGDGFL